MTFLLIFIQEKVLFIHAITLSYIELKNKINYIIDMGIYYRYGAMLNKLDFNLRDCEIGVKKKSWDSFVFSTQPPLNLRSTATHVTHS